MELLSRDNFRKPATCPFCKVSFNRTEEPNDYGRKWSRIICMNCRYFYESSQLREDERLFNEKYKYLPSGNISL